MKTDRLLAVAAVLLGIPGFVLVFFDKTWAVGAVTLILGLVLGGGLIGT